MVALLPQPPECMIEVCNQAQQSGLLFSYCEMRHVSESALQFREDPWDEPHIEHTGLSVSLGALMSAWEVLTPTLCIENLSALK